MRANLIIAIVLTALCTASVAVGDDSVFGKIKSGFAYAGKLLGLDRASDVAQLVSDAFSRTNRKGDPGDPGNTLFSGFLRVLGFDTKRIGAIAVNAIIFIAQIISTSLSKPPPAYVTEQRKLDGTPLDWMLGNQQVQQYMKHITDVKLPQHIIGLLKTGAGSENTGCLQLLICKGAPLVWGMQRAIKDKNTTKGMHVLTKYLPTMSEIANNGDVCETKFPHCKLHLT